MVDEIPRVSEQGLVNAARPRTKAERVARVVVEPEVG